MMQNSNSIHPKNNNSVYLPKERDFLIPSASELKSCSLEGSCIQLPDPTQDPIVCNNIVCAEFDYTERNSNLST